MKPTPTPVGGQRIRYDHQKTGQLDELGKLDDLIKFLDTVGPNARLRAKEENGMTFLHTRTGTPLGRFLKWISIGWTEAVDQRQRARDFVKGVLDKIGGENEFGSDGDKYIQSLKNEILEKTLKVKPSEEFNIDDLKKNLVSLKQLAEAYKNKQTTSIQNVTPNSGSTVSKLTNVTDDLSAQSDLGDDAGSEAEDESDFPDKNPTFSANADPAPLSGQIKASPANAVEVSEEPRKVESEMEASDEEIPVPNLPESLSSTPQTSQNAQDFISIVEIQSLIEGIYINDNADLLPTQISSDKDSLVSPSKDVPPESNSPPSSKPASSVKPAPQPRTLRAVGEIIGTPTFGLKKIDSSLATYGRNLGFYEADAYIFPATEKLDFKRGKVTLTNEELSQNGITISKKTQTQQYINDKNANDLGEKKREFFQLSLAQPDEPQATEAYQQKLEALYRSAVQQAINSGAKTLAIKPFHPTGDSELINLSIAALVNALKLFEQRQPAPTVLTLLFSDGQVTLFNSLKKTGSPVGSLNSFS